MLSRLIALTQKNESCSVSDSYFYILKKISIYQIKFHRENFLLCQIYWHSKTDDFEYSSQHILWLAIWMYLFYFYVQYLYFYVWFFSLHTKNMRLKYKTWIYFKVNLNRHNFKLQCAKIWKRLHFKLLEIPRNY